MSSNNIVPLSNKSDAPSEKVKKASGDLDYIENTLVTTIDTVGKNENQNKMWWGKPKLVLFQKKKKYRHSLQNREITNIKKTVPTSKKINPTHLTQYIKQGLLQELIYLIKLL